MIRLTASPPSQAKNRDPLFLHLDRSPQSRSKNRPPPISPCESRERREAGWLGGQFEPAPWSYKQTLGKAKTLFFLWFDRVAPKSPT
jgi:hypothetical protein